MSSDASAQTAPPVDAAQDAAWNRLWDELLAETAADDRPAPIIDDEPTAAEDSM